MTAHPSLLEPAPDRTWEILRDRFPLNSPLSLGFVDAPSYEAARRLGVEKFGNPILVMLKQRSTR